MDILSVEMDRDEAFVGGEIDASRWAKSIGLSTKCRICAGAFNGIGRGNGEKAMAAEDVASLAMGILNKVKRLSFRNDSSTLEFEFKPMWSDKEHKLKAFFETTSGDEWLVVKKV